MIISMSPPKMTKRHCTRESLARISPSLSMGSPRGDTGHMDDPVALPFVWILNSTFCL